MSVVARRWAAIPDRIRVRIGRTMVAVSAAFGLFSLWAYVSRGEAGNYLLDGRIYDDWILHNVVLGAFGMSLLVWFAIRPQPRNGAVWALAWSGLFQGINAAANAWVLLASNAAGIDGRAEAVPFGDLPLSVSIPLQLGSWTWIPGLVLLLTLVLLLLPDGRLLSRRWRPVAWLSVASITALSAAFFWMARPRDEAVSMDTVDPPWLGPFFLPVLASVIACTAGLIVRYRASRGEQRVQLRWIAWGGALFGLSSLTFPVPYQPGGLDVFSLASLVSGTLLLAALYIAITKHRLYDIDVVISKSVTYVGLAAAITLLYSAVVVGPLLVVGLPDEGGPGLALPIAATAVVAVLFEPIRSRTQAWANRLVYGNRSTPHEVLSQLTARLGETTASETDDLARLLAEGTGADQAAVWLRVGETLHPSGVWPADRTNGREPRPTDSPLEDKFSATTLVQHGDEVLGALSITKPRNDPVTPSDTDLLADVAASAGLVLRNISLNSQLEERAHQVRASRQRLIAAQDAERHRLERDLHDGAQQQVVALKVKLGLAKIIAEREGAGEIAVLVAGLADETQEAVDAMREVAHGIYPPLLEAEGLEPALTAIRRSAAIPVEVNVSGIGRHTRQLEETVYFCVLEIISQTSMAGAGEVHVSLESTADSLEVVATYDATARPPVLTALIDRIDAAEGTFEVGATENHTRIAIRLPVRQLEPA